MVKDYTKFNVGKKQNKFIFAGGGTGGHLFTAIAIAEELKHQCPEAQILFVGTSDKLEASVIPNLGYKFHSIWISGLQRRRLFTNIILPVKIFVSLVQTLVLLLRYKPSVVVGTGGYVSAPVLYTASLLKIKTLIHEQNIIPGKTTKFLSKRVDEVHITFEDSACYLTKSNNVYISGNPIRKSLDEADYIDACYHFGFDPQDNTTTLLVFGGSLGAHSINMVMANIIDRILEAGIRVIWQTGKGDFEWIHRRFSQYPTSKLWVGEFINKMNYAYKVSALVVCRAGATTIAELTMLGKPAILIPYPSAVQDHQTKNAQYLAQFGAAFHIDDSQLEQKLLETILNLISDPEKLESMGNRSKKMGKKDAAQTIVRHILILSGNKSIKTDAT